jgi:hypothetical protein
MLKKTVLCFMYVASVLLLVTALAKIISSAGSTRILQESDPILMLPYRWVFLAVGWVELILALICIFGNRLMLKLSLIAWLATIFLMYRIGLWWIDWKRPCKCLGNLTDTLHIPAQTAETIMKMIVGYLLVGSYLSLFWFWRQSKKSNLTPISAQ